MPSQYDDTMVASQPPPGQTDEMPTQVIGAEARVPPTVPPAAPFGLGPASSEKTVLLKKEPPSFAWLIILEGPRAGHIFRLNTEGTTIGRDPQNDIILDDETVSRQHAKVRAEENEDGELQFFIYDLATSNGTFVNGEQIVKQGLSDGDVVEMGKTKLVFKRIQDTGR